MKRTEDSLRDFWDNIRHTNIRIIGLPEEEENKKGFEKIFEEIIVENFSSIEKEIVNHVHSASLCFLVGAFNPFTFKVIIDIYVTIAIFLIVWD